jgi:hypothetical protein
MRWAVKVLPLGVLGYAAALLVACGGGDEGLLPEERAAGLREALVQVQSACAAGDPGGAASAAQAFSDRVAELSGREADPRLIANLEQGAATLRQLAGSTCESQEPSTTVPTTPTTPTTTVPTTTVPTTTVPTTTVPTTPTTTVPNGGGSDGDDGDDDDGQGPPGGAPPGQAKRGNSGGAGAGP